jgi:hypothetical protein
MLAGLATVAQNVRVQATGVFQGVREDGEVLKTDFIVNGLVQLNYRATLPRQPGGVNLGAAEGVAENVPKEVALPFA